MKQNEAGLRQRAEVMKLLEGAVAQWVDKVYEQITEGVRQGGITSPDGNAILDLGWRYIAALEALQSLISLRGFGRKELWLQYYQARNCVDLAKELSSAICRMHAVARLPKEIQANISLPEKVDGEVCEWHKVLEPLSELVWS